ncbi:MAG: hypothetical protein ABH848_03910 [Candidatus Omnitrophota bacterium]
MKRNSALIAILMLLILNVGIVALVGASEEGIKPLEREATEIDVEMYGEYIPMDPEDITPMPNTNSDAATYFPSAKVTDTEIEFY